jgi:hypothetical protein
VPVKTAAISRTDHRDVGQGGIFAVKDDVGGVVLTQVEAVRGADPLRMRCTPRNALYRPFELDLGRNGEIHRAQIIGRAGARITRRL